MGEIGEGRAMTEEHGKIDGDLSVEGDFVLHGMVTGTVTVNDGGDLVLNGMVRDLVITPGGRCVLHGTVANNVVNRGGMLAIFGTINGALDTTDGSTTIDPGAVIGGKHAGSN
jgi:cytoskeletal protein CcmA (bactofilin family)